MKRRSAALSIACAVATAACTATPPSGQGRTTAATANAATTDTPAACCDDVAVGETYVYRLFSGAIEERTITSVSPSEVTFRLRERVGDHVIRETDDRWDRAARARTNLVVPGANHRQSAPRTRKVGARTFVCVVHEGDDEGAHYEEWRSTSFPYVIAVIVDGRAMIELVAIETAPR